MSDASREFTLRVLAAPTDVNFGGKVHGGTVMKWIDQVGYACAVGWSKHYCVTVYVGGIRFMQPIFIGNVVELVAKVIHTGSSSMHIYVDVHARDLKDAGYRQTTRCLMVFVAVDEAGKPVPVPNWEPRTEEDILWEQQALQHLELSKEVRRRLEDFFGAD